jgi:hypothetical protein
MNKTSPLQSTDPAQRRTDIPGQNPKADDAPQHDVHHDESRHNLYDPAGRELTRPPETSRFSYERNVGGWDRNIRFILGGASLAAGLLGPFRAPWRVALLALAATQLSTASSQYCPLNQALRINTDHPSQPEAMPG